MALLAWEEVRLSTLNKIFILAHNITMIIYGVVKRGHFCVSWSLSSLLEDELKLEYYYNWDDAYHAFRFHVFPGHGYVDLSYSSYSGGADEYRDIVRFLNWRGTSAFKWYYGQWTDLEGRVV